MGGGTEGGGLSVSSFSLHWFTFMLKGNLRSWVNIDREGEGVIML